ncbi:RDD family protein, partial [Nonomuraea aridisoli]
MGHPPQPQDPYGQHRPQQPYGYGGHPQYGYGPQPPTSPP